MPEPKVTEEEFKEICLSARRYESQRGLENYRFAVIRHKDGSLFAGCLDKHQLNAHLTLPGNTLLAWVPWYELEPEIRLDFPMLESQLCL